MCICNRALMLALLRDCDCSSLTKRIEEAGPDLQASGFQLVPEVPLTQLLQKYH